MKYSVQVRENHYFNKSYLNLDRWVSYFYQIESIKNVCVLHLKKKLRILEIGVGDGLVSSILRKNGHNTLTLDFDETLQPDIVSSLPNPNLKGVASFDCVLCCEVLEHLKYDDAIRSLEFLTPKTKYFVISIPHKSFYLSFSLKMSLIRRMSLLLTFPTNFIAHKFNGEHYWELGSKDYSTDRFVSDCLNINLKCVDDFRVGYYPYHHFFIFERLVKP